MLSVMQDSLPTPDARAQAHSEQLVAQLREEIAAQGPMPFSRYMERCLYAPGLGYYSAGSTKLGADGDFITAPELGEVFARCVVRAIMPVMMALGDDAQVVELGGGSGAFAAVALQALAVAGTPPHSYAILEPSADLRERQREHLQTALPADLFARVRWLDGPPSAAWRGVLFANEVIDALPATRFLIRDHEVFEEYVQVGEDGRLERIERPADALVGGAVRHVEQYLGERLADGYRSEILPQLPYWMQAVAGSLQAGMMLFVDYGHERRDYYHRERSDGTLRAYYRHRTHTDPFFWPGLQDLTASVDFTAMAEAGHVAGFDLAAYLPQAQFLIASGLQDIFAQMHAALDGETDRYALAQQIKQLTLPGQMGEPFRAMVLTRGLDPAATVPEAMREFDRSSRL